MKCPTFAKWLSGGLVHVYCVCTGQDVYCVCTCLCVLCVYVSVCIVCVRVCVYCVCVRVCVYCVSVCLCLCAYRDHAAILYDSHANVPSRNLIYHQ